VPINIKDIRISSDFIRMAVENGDADRTVRNPVKTAKYDSYTQAISKAKRFCSPDVGIVTYDDPEDKFEYHSLTIKLNRDEFEGDEISRLTEIIDMFDGLMFYGSSTGDISIQLIMDNVYTEGNRF